MIEMFETGPGGIPTIVKTPAEILDYLFTWVDWLGADTISTANITVDSGLTVVSTVISLTTVQVFVSGGQVGQTLRVNCKVVTAGARTSDRSILLSIQLR
jgi:hypothetical protein